MSYMLRKAQRGFAMLEVLLAVIVIAMVSFGVYQMYQSSSKNSQLSNAEQAVTQVMSAAGQYVAQNYDAPSSGALIDANLIPAKLYNSSEALVSPYGTMTLAGDDTNFQHYELEVVGVPPDSATSFCSDLGSSYDILYSGTDVSGDCNSSFTAATGTVTLTVVNPKGYSG